MVLVIPLIALAVVVAGMHSIVLGHVQRHAKAAPTPFQRRQAAWRADYDARRR